MTGTPLELVHRDLSPDNVMVTYDGTVKLLELGIAKSAALKREHRTRTGVLKGKLRYMAPEQLGGDEVDRRTDLFAVGIMLWEALAGRRIWEDMSEGDQMRALINGDWPSLRDVRSGLPETLYEVVDRALQENVLARLPQARAFRDLLTKGVAELGVRGDGQELAEFMRVTFAAEREATHARIMRRVDSNVQGWSQAPPAMFRTPVSAHRETVTKVGAKSTNPPRGRWRQRIGIILGGAAVLASAVGALLVWQPLRSIKPDSHTPCNSPGLIDDFEDGDGWNCSGTGREEAADGALLRRHRAGESAARSRTHAERAYRRHGV